MSVLVVLYAGFDGLGFPCFRVPGLSPCLTIIYIYYIYIIYILYIYDFVINMCIYIYYFIVYIYIYK